jgi:hypothetical protein
VDRAEDLGDRATTAGDVNADPAAVGRGPRQMRSGRVVIPLVLLLLVALALGTRACGDRGTAVDQDEAVAIAEEAAGFAVAQHQVRFIRQGVDQTPGWVVGLRGVDGEALTMVIDARTGEISDVQR